MFMFKDMNDEALLAELEEIGGVPAGKGKEKEIADIRKKLREVESQIAQDTSAAVLFKRQGLLEVRHHHDQSYYDLEKKKRKRELR
jgi:hypothetical protein